VTRLHPSIAITSLVKSGTVASHPSLAARKRGAGQLVINGGTVSTIESAATLLVATPKMLLTCTT
jgi:hypothetical protein